MNNTNQGIVYEYYEIFQQALRIELKREPTHEEIMYHVNIIIKKYHDK